MSKLKKLLHLVGDLFELHNSNFYLQYVMVQAIIFVNQIKCSLCHNTCHVFVKNLAVDDSAMNGWEPVVRHTSSPWMTFLETLYNPLSSP